MPTLAPWIRLKSAFGQGQLYMQLVLSWQVQKKTRSIIEAKEAYTHRVHRICHHAFLSASHSASKLHRVSQTSPGYSTRRSGGHTLQLWEITTPKPADGSCCLACKLQTCKSGSTALCSSICYNTLIDAHTGLNTSRFEVEAGLKGLF